jgi:secondary thiamine-phosphate synthase enzyme
MIKQFEILLKSKSRGFHLITQEILTQLDPLPTRGLLNLFIKHTSAGITINENADSTVREDFEAIFNRLIPENESYYKHTCEGPDDMPAHVKSSIVGTSLQIPISDRKLNIGTWQGIYLCEFRNHGGPRKIVITVIGEN